MSQEKRPSLREAARRGVEAKQQAQAAQPAPAQPAAAPPPVAKTPAAAPPQRPKPPVIGVEQVVVRCGHTVPFELFDPRKDKFRDGRRKKLTDRDCPACRQKAHEERTRAEMEAARKLRLSRPKKERLPTRPQGRLPHGANFNATWDASKGEWSGTLTVPTPGAEGSTRNAVFTAAASGVFKLLQVLDDTYRATLPAPAGPAASEAPAS